REAVRLHKPIEALESADFQIKLFSSLTAELQEQLLLTTLLGAEAATETLDRTLAAWSAGDDAAMEAVMMREVRRHPSLEPVMEKMFYERNDAMTRKPEQYLKTGKTYFVAVGAGHLVGERGILSQLRQRNLTVERP